MAQPPALPKRRLTWNWRGTWKGRLVALFALPLFLSALWLWNVNRGLADVLAQSGFMVAALGWLLIFRARKDKGALPLDSE